MQLPTNNILFDALNAHFHTLRHLSLNHAYLTSFPWATHFTALEFLCLAQEHIFPSQGWRRPQFALDELVPRSLRRLIITECDFGVDVGVVDENGEGRGDVLEQGVLGLMEMVLASPGEYRLTEIGLEVVEGGEEVPERVVRAVERLGWGGVVDDDDGRVLDYCEVGEEGERGAELSEVEESMSSLGVYD